MLNDGADIRQVQAMRLGHADRSTTQVYAHVAIESLQRGYESTHPACRPQARLHKGPAFYAERAPAQ